MAVINLIDTTFTAKDIHTVLSVYEYTVPAGGPYKLRFQLRLYNVAGGGDYTVYLNLNDGDAQTDDPIAPKTTYTAVAGAQSLWFTTISVDVLSGDVINVMALGLAGDTAVTGSIRIFADDAVGPTTYGRTLDVAATGEAGVDLSNVLLPGAPATLTNIVVPTVSSVAGLGAGAINAAAIADDAIDAGSIKADAVTKIQSGLSTLTAAQVWSCLNRTLTNAVAPGTTEETADNISRRRGDSWSIAITGLGSLAGYVAIDFTVKEDMETDLDEEARLRIRKNASGLSDGLVSLWGGEVLAADGLITIDDATAGDITITVEAEATMEMRPALGLNYDIQMITASGVQTLANGVFNILADVTRAIV